MYRKLNNRKYLHRIFAQKNERQKALALSNFMRRDGLKERKKEQGWGKGKICMKNAVEDHGHIIK